MVSLHGELIRVTWTDIYQYLSERTLMFLAVVGDSSQIQCSYQDVLNFLNLTKDNELYSMTRPVKDYTQPTAVSLELLLYAILDVVSG